MKTTQCKQAIGRAILQKFNLWCIAIVILFSLSGCYKEGRNQCGYPEKIKLPPEGGMFKFRGKVCLTKFNLESDYSKRCVSVPGYDFPENSLIVGETDPDEENGSEPWIYVVVTPPEPEITLVVKPSDEYRGTQLFADMGEEYLLIDIYQNYNLFWNEED